MLGPKGNNMKIPKFWFKASTDCQTRENKKLHVQVWGWGDDMEAARQEASSRLRRLVDRVRRGEPFPRGYGYGNHPLREEILETYAGESGPAGMLTRNRYGALILNTASLLFLDIDLPPVGLLQRLRAWFSRDKKDPNEPALAALREALQKERRATFRIYRTAAGMRVMAVDREYDPGSAETQALMQATKTDTAFSRLCQAQKSFRARLTPKPWRCGSAKPPGQYPRDDGKQRSDFERWLKDYERRCEKFATCRYLETVGSAAPKGAVAKMVELHDRLTRADVALPLA